MKSGIRTGTTVIASTDENAIASVFVQASGLNVRPSWASSRKAGRKREEQRRPDLLCGR